jgi:hypothetical protein
MIPTTTTGKPALSLEDLRSYDPKGGQGSREKRFCCPLCGGDKPRDGAHRSLAVNASTGAWTCHRCKERGLLTDNWRDRPPISPKVRARERLRHWATVRPVVAREPPEASIANLRRQLVGREALAGSPGYAYLLGRGIPADVLDELGEDIRYHPNWYGKGPAVVFAMRDRGGKVIAANGRFLEPGASPKTMTAGPKSLGVLASPGAFNRRLLVVAEGPIDVLSLYTAGGPAVALVGTTMPEWLPERGAFRLVLLATDADEAGDTAALALAPAFLRFGAREVRRLRPPVGKDWNDALLAMGADELGSWLGERA